MKLLQGRNCESQLVNNADTINCPILQEKSVHICLSVQHDRQNPSHFPNGVSTDIGHLIQECLLNVPIKLILR